MRMSHLYVYWRRREAIKFSHSIEGRKRNQDNPASTFYPWHPTSPVAVGEAERGSVPCTERRVSAGGRRARAVGAGGSLNWMEAPSLVLFLRVFPISAVFSQGPVFVVVLKFNLWC